MRIRWKLAILLLAIALLPLGLVSWFAARATRELGDELAGRARAVLDEQARLGLRQTVDEYGRLLRREAQYLEFALRVQAREVERCLAAPPSAAARVYRASDLTAGDAALPGARPSIRHPFPSPRSGRLPRQVSYEQPVIYECPGPADAGRRADMNRLAAMTPVYRFLASTTPRDLIVWHTVTLESGVHSAFPGHGRFPEGFDPRRFPSYASLGSTDVRWTGLARDPITDTMILTLSVGVRRPDDTPAGVTAIDVGAEDAFRTVRLPPGWARNARIFLVQQSARADSGDRGLRILAWQDPAGESAQWNTPPADEWLTSSDTLTFGQMSDKMAIGQSGVWLLPMGEWRCLWAHARAHAPDVHVLVVVRYDSVVDAATAAAAAVRSRFADQLRVSAWTVFTIAGVVVALAWLASRSVTRPLQELTATARRIAEGDFEARADVRGSDEIGELGRTFNDMIPHLRDGMRLRESLALAQEVQQALLPQTPPTFPGFDIHGVSQYCEQTGGDYYDFLDISGVGPSGLGIAVGDVTGHGVAAALLMATARALLRGRASECSSLGDLLTDINRHLSHGAPPDRYMTLFYVAIDAARGTLRWASAGHDAAIVYAPDVDQFSELRGDGIPLALEPSWRYEEHNGQMIAPGQVILIGTDGIWETRDAANRMFGKEAVRELMQRHAREPAEKIVQAITDAIRTFRGARPQEDDVTLVVVRRAPHAPPTSA